MTKTNHVVASDSTVKIEHEFLNNGSHRICATSGNKHWVSALASYRGFAVLEIEGLPVVVGTTEYYADLPRVFEIVVCKEVEG